MDVALSWIWVAQILLMILVSILGTVLGGHWLLRHRQPRVEIHIIETAARSFEEVRSNIEQRLQEQGAKPEWRYTPAAMERLQRQGMKEGTE